MRPKGDLLRALFSGIVAAATETGHVEITVGPPVRSSVSQCSGAPGTHHYSGTNLWPGSYLAVPNPCPIGMFLPPTASARPPRWGRFLWPTFIGPQTRVTGPFTRPAR
jgi:hypothetical protein